MPIEICRFRQSFYIRNNNYIYLDHTRVVIITSMIRYNTLLIMTLNCIIL